MVAGFIGLRTGSRRVRSKSLGSLECTLGDVWIVRGRYVHLGCPKVSSGSYGVAEFILGAPWGASVSFGVA